MARTSRENAKNAKNADIYHRSRLQFCITDKKLEFTHANHA